MPDFSRRLVEFAPGSSINGAVFAVSDVSVKSTKNGDAYLQLKLRDCTGERAAKMWNAPADILEQLGNAKLIKVRGFVEAPGKFGGEFRLQWLQAFPHPDDLTPYLPPLPDDHAAHKARFVDIVRAVKNPHLSALLKEIFRSSGELWPRFCEAPAAKSKHHDYRGGLLEHSGEVALLCERVSSTLPHINRDLLLTAALLHDIGKLEELESGLDSGSYTHAGQLVGHVVLGTCLVANAAAKIEGFPPTLKHEIMHLILSHHGEPEWGAARRPMCAEALILSSCDQMSAKIAQCHCAAKAEGDDHFPRSTNFHGAPNSPQNAVYVGLMRASMEEEL